MKTQEAAPHEPEPHQGRFFCPGSTAFPRFTPPRLCRPLASHGDVTP